MNGVTIAVQGIDGQGEFTDYFELAVRVEPGSEAVDFSKVGGSKRGVTWMVNLEDFDAALKALAAERRRG